MKGYLAIAIAFLGILPFCFAESFCPECIKEEVEVDREFIKVKEEVEKDAEFLQSRDHERRSWTWKNLTTDLIKVYD